MRAHLSYLYEKSIHIIWF